MCSSSARKTRVATVGAALGIAAATLTATVLVMQHVGDTGEEQPQGTVQPCSAYNATSDSPPASDLQSVIEAAAPGDTIQVSGTCTGGFVIDKKLTLGKSPGSERPVLDGGSTEKVLRIVGTRDAPVGVVLRGLTITGGSAQNGAGVMSTNAHVAVKRSTISGNVAKYSGGGLKVDRGSLTLVKSIVVDNTAGQVGGGVYDDRQGRVRMGVDSVVARNEAKYGGGIGNDGLVVMLRTAIVRDNSARSGGGIGTYSGDLSGLLIMRQQASVTSNTARYCGGIQTISYAGMNPVRVRMNGTSTVSANAGGGVCLASTALVMRGRSSVTTNQGGGILAHDAADWRVGSRPRVVIDMSDAASVSRNSGARGAGIFLEWAGGANCATCSNTPPRMVLQDRASVTRNTASVTGGGIYVKGGSVVLRNRAAVVKNSPDDIVIRPRT